jgi:O-antigen ligase
MSGSLRFWEVLLLWSLPAMILAVGIFPPHVIPSLGAPLALGGLLLVLALAGAGRLRSPRAAVALPLATAGLLALLSALMSFQPLLSVRTLSGWFLGGIVMVAAGSAASRAEARRVAVAIAVLATLLAALGLYQSLVAFPSAGDRRARSDLATGAAPVAGKEASLREAEEARLRTGRAVGTLGFPAALASILILGLPLSLVEAIESAGPARAAWIAAAIVQILALVATRSLGGAVSLAVAVLACLPGWKDLPAPRRKLVVGAILLAGALVAAPRLLGSGTGSAAQAAELRSANWRAAISMIVSHPLLGVGPGNYGVAFPLHRTWASNETQHAHNAYLEAISDVGLPIAPFLVMAVASLIAWTRERDDPETRWRRRGLSLACLAWSAQNFFDFTAYLSASAIPFLAAAGLLMRGETGGAPRPRAGAVTRSTLLIVSVLIVLVAIPDALSRIHLDRAVDLAARLDFEGAVAEARSGALFDPFDPEARVVLSQSLIDAVLHRPPADPERGKMLEEALFEAEEGARTDPMTANRRAALAMAQAAVGDAAGAYASMAAAARLNPYKPTYAEERDRMLAILERRPAAGTGGGGPAR